MSDKHMHSLHIEILESLHQELKMILPGRGEVTKITRHFLQKYAQAYRRGVKGGPLEKAAEEVIESQREKGFLDG